MLSLADVAKDRQEAKRAWFFGLNPQACHIVQ